MTTASPVALVFVEHILWTPDDAWSDALQHLSSRFARVAELDVDAVLAAGPLHHQIVELTAWAGDAGADIDRELGRFLDEHLSMHLRPSPAVTRAVRALAATGPVHLVSALPPRAAESLARHAGCWRSIEELHASVTTTAALATVVERTGATTIVAAPGTAVPAGTALSTLDEAAATTS